MFIILLKMRSVTTTWVGVPQRVGKMWGNFEVPGECWSVFDMYKSLVATGRLCLCHVQCMYAAITKHSLVDVLMLLL